MNTFRRELLDRFLLEHQGLMTGLVLDIGGKKENKRGEFRPPASNVHGWIYANIDEKTKPDYLCSAEQLPLDDEGVDVFLLCEVLEHLENPEVVLSEAYRVLRPGGHGLLTIPFLYPIHGDPYDFQRWTEEKLKMVLLGVGFEIVNISAMGGAIAVILDLLQIRYGEMARKMWIVGRLGFIPLKIIKYVLRPFALRAHPRITTGFSVVVRKDDQKKS